MKILLLGSGGREHALARALGADPATTALFVAPGNPGTATCGVNVPLDPCDPPAVAQWALENGIDLVVVGPEAPLVAGVADAVRDAGIAVFGPSRAAARLEGSKAFAKEVMEAADVPTAKARVCDSLAEVADALDDFGAPHVVKQDGLAAGKGVVVTEDRAAALAHAEACLAVGSVVVEDFLDGPEVSLFCVCDGVRALPLAPAQDFKRAFDGDAGPNTGGMGAYCPLEWADESLADDVVRTVAEPVLVEMARRGEPLVGLLYCGLALTRNGTRVVEFNVRFGDPETQVVLPLLATPLASLLFDAATGNLGGIEDLAWLESAAVGVVVAAEGYPGPVRSGDPIGGIAEAERIEGVHVIHAGTAVGDDGAPVSAGGRVLSVVGVAPSLAEARARAYAGVGRIELAGSHHRADIALRASAEAEAQ